MQRHEISNYLYRKQSLEKRVKTLVVQQMVGRTVDLQSEQWEVLLAHNPGLVFRLSWINVPFERDTTVHKGTNIIYKL